MTDPKQPLGRGGPSQRGRRSESGDGPPNPRPRYKWDAEDWLAALAKTGCVTGACKSLGIGVSTAYDRRNNDGEFAARWNDVTKATNERLVSSAMNRAIEGWDEPVFHDGVECGVKRKFSDTLTIFLLKTRLPKQYHDQVVAAREIAELGLNGQDADDTEPDLAYE